MTDLTKQPEYGFPNFHIDTPGNIKIRCGANDTLAEMFNDELIGMPISEMVKQLRDLGANLPAQPRVIVNGIEIRNNSFGSYKIQPGQEIEILQEAGSKA